MRILIATLLQTCVAVLLLFTGCRAEAVSRDDKAVRVLFIGNSLTAANNLPGMVADIARSHGHKLIYDAYTPGGVRLKQHASNPVVLQKMKEQSWDFVVLQEQSQFPGFSQKQLAKEVFPYAQRLAVEARQANRDTSVVFYMTMARRNGDPGNQRVSTELLTYKGMQKRVNRCYVEMAKNNRAVVSPVGEVWKAVRERNPNVDLYSDDIHPNPTGTYLAACVFYATFFESASTGSPAPRQIDAATVQSLQRVVDAIVLRAEDRWDYRE